MLTEENKKRYLLIYPLTMIVIICGLKMGQQPASRTRSEHSTSHTFTRRLATNTSPGNGVAIGHTHQNHGADRIPHPRFFSLRAALLLPIPKLLEGELTLGNFIKRRKTETHGLISVRALVRKASRIPWGARAFSGDLYSFTTRSVPRRFR